MMLLLAKQVVNNSNLVLATDVGTKNLLSFLSNKTKYACIPTPIETKAYTMKKSTNVEAGRLENEHVTLGFIGRLAPQKNLGTLLKAFATAETTLQRRLKLVIVGDGPEKSFLMHEAERLGLSGEIVFAGTVTSNRKAELLNGFDIFVLPSLYEGSPIALLEAMASGKAIISSDIPSVRAIARHNEEAILVNPYDVDELKQAILLLCNDPNLRMRLGRKARERAKLYDANVIFKQLLKTYEELPRPKNASMHVVKFLSENQPNISRISEVLKQNAERIFSGPAQERALQDVWIKSRYISCLSEVSEENSLELSKARILDIGCSKADILLAMQKLGLGNLTGLNLFPFNLQWLSDNLYCEQYFGDVAGKIKYIVCDVDSEGLPLKDSSYDVVLLMDIIEHLHDPERVLLECHRVLSPGGLIAISTVNGASLRNRVFAFLGRSIYYPLDEWLGSSQRINNGSFRRFIGHVREYTMSEIDSMMRKYGFQVLLKRYYASHIGRVSFLYRLYTLLEKLYPRFAYHMFIVCRKPISNQSFVEQRLPRLHSDSHRS
jgi:2-polyprenyl-3-methyl-5-hydroxy-6-metoxy-1,4-benzoquinol methylase